MWNNMNNFFRYAKESIGKISLEQDYLLAVSQGNLVKLKELIHSNSGKFDPFVKQIWPYDYNAVELALLNNQIEVVNYLVEVFGFTISISRADYIFPEIVENDYSKSVDYLIQENLINLNANRQDINRALISEVPMRVRMGGSIEMNGYYSPLYLACSKGSYKVVKNILNRENIDVNLGAEYTVNVTNIDDMPSSWDVKRSPIEVATWRGHQDIVDLLLTHDPNLIVPKETLRRCVIS